jgi:hypothetical protein
VVSRGWLPSERLVSFAFERDVYIQQVSLLFRRHGLSKSLDSLEQF